MLAKRSARLALRYHARAAALGDSNGMVAVADALSVPPVTAGALARAAALYRRAYRHGNSWGAHNLAVTYQNLGRHRVAVQWFRRALAAGDLGALLPLAQAELYGIGTRRDSKAAFAKLGRIAAAADTAFISQFDREEAMVTMAEALRHGWLVRRDYRAAIGWLRRAGRVGSAAATGLLTDLGE